MFSRATGQCVVHPLGQPLPPSRASRSEPKCALAQLLAVPFSLKKSDVPSTAALFSASWLGDASIIIWAGVLLQYDHQAFSMGSSSNGVQPPSPISGISGRHHSQHYIYCGVAITTAPSSKLLPCCCCPVTSCSPVARATRYILCQSARPVPYRFGYLSPRHWSSRTFHWQSIAIGSSSSCPRPRSTSRGL